MQSVLIIDDNPEVRNLIAQTLQIFGFQTTEAQDGRSGIQLALADEPTLIICDVNMPDMDGYHTLAAIREEPRIANIPFIFLTGSTEKQELRRGMLSGADDYLTKPFTADDLLEAVSSRLARHVELKCEVHKQAEKLRDDVLRLLSQEISQPLNTVLELTASLMQDHAFLAPEMVFAKARQINESVRRVNQITRSLE